MTVYDARNIDLDHVNYNELTRQFVSLSNQQQSGKFITNCGAAFFKQEKQTMKTIILPWLVILLSILAACGSSGEANYDKKFQQSELSRNQILWQNSNFATYQYTYRVSCNCLFTESVTVYVNNGEISEAYVVESGDSLSATEIKQLLTIEQLFAAVQRAIDKNAYNLSVTYQPQQGFPETIAIDFNKDIADDEVTYYVKDLE